MDTTIMYILLNITIMITLIGLIYFLYKKQVSFTKRLLIALVLGIVFGLTMKYFYESKPTIIKETMKWINIIGIGYIRLIKMMVIPLILVSIISAIVKLTNSQDVWKMSLSVIFILIFTAGIAAIIGICTSLFFKLTSEGLQSGTDEIMQGTRLNQGLARLQQNPITQKLSELIPENIFADMAGTRPNSTIGIVIFAALVGIVALRVSKKKPESIEFFKKIISTVQDLTSGLIILIIKSTPYAILAMITKISATSDISNIMKLGKFVFASYVAIGITLLMHMTLIALNRLNPITFIKKAWPVLTFAFISRSSTATIPVNVEVQTKQLGVSEGIANLSSAFGASIGQNGCAALHPAMLAIMIAPTQGINPTNPLFILQLIGIIIITSFGVAGAGGGATIASLMVLSSMNLPVELVGLLISIEPLIDMGRTSVNVSDSMIAGVITAKTLKQLDRNIYNNKNEIAK
ncbi:L-cystine transporter [Borrelia miyamotoi]|uniref:Cation:dicarboxylase symporter family transporter n=1 Tax=Borrelia miyamotoi TaxID=47466 RepID=A0AAQ2X090_9SPIR|nr:cation:dicarboxylase symporter family transporter [Borrelia miyamotoi]AGT27673.1 L-cystine transporter tcyP [Borrelia miyamotoi LB-2001]AJA58832.1 sodium:dicarboxylate symporter [Borrelia miyamotoi]AOW95917.1 sodium:dicarboxylate symporter [Borrelia miyamotoi]WAZ84885.1 cation:dicarboxylase symporter family transporter [Borrelia miyamotoi]WAZ90668.1 cation:dicarboxylase symporter family transporter [Borrelia miyamotoi]